jgi:hypothetical protein
MSIICNPDDMFLKLEKTQSRFIGAKIQFADNIRSFIYYNSFAPPLKNILQRF